MAKKQKSTRRKYVRARQREISAKDVTGFFTGLLNVFVVGVLSDDRKEAWHQHLRRLLVGAAGGAFYAAVKNYIAEGSGIVKVIIMEPGARRTEMFLGYWLAPIMSAVIGGVAAWLSQVRSNRLLFLMGMLGILLLQNLFGLQTNQKTGQLIKDWLPISSAYAENGSQCVGDSALIKGFKAFFGSQEHYDKYAVVIASGKNKSDAEAKLKRLKTEYPNLILHVGPRSCDNIFYPVFASEYLPAKDAKKILEQVRKLDPSTADAYLSPGPKDAESN